MSLKEEARLRTMVEQIAQMDIPRSYNKDGSAGLDDETLRGAAYTLYSLIIQCRKLIKETSHA